MFESTKRVWATIDSNAFRKNLAIVSELCPTSRIFAVVKSNAYGHGVEKIATVALGSSSNVVGLAVATIQEAIELHNLELGHPILLMNGFVNKEELSLCIELNFEIVLHAYYQVELVMELIRKKPWKNTIRFWVKMNSGMNRLGMLADDCQKTLTILKSAPNTEIVFMTHLAYADDMSNPESRSFTEKQLGRRT